MLSHRRMIAYDAATTLIQIRVNLFCSLDPYLTRKHETSIQYWVIAVPSFSTLDGRHLFVGLPGYVSV